MLNAKTIVVGVQSDDPFTGDIAHYMLQEVDVSDILSYKEFANTEFQRVVGTSVWQKV